MKKRLLAMLMAQALVISSVSAPVYAADSTSGLPGYEDVTDEILAGTAESEDLSDESVTEEALDDWVIEDDAFEEEITDEETDDVDADAAEEDLSQEDSEEGGSEETVDEIAEDAAETDEAAPEDESTEVAPGDTEAIKEITDELKEKKEEEGTELDLTPLVEERLEAQEEILLGKPAASDVRACDDTEAYAQSICDINMAHPGDFDAQIVLDVEKGTISNEAGEELVGADSTVLSALEETDAKEAATLLEEKGYANVTCEDNVVKADDPFATGRLYVMSSEQVDTRGALSVITFGETNIIQYASPAEAAIASEMLKDDAGVWEIVPDAVMSIEDAYVYREDASEGEQAGEYLDEDLIEEESVEEGLDEITVGEDSETDDAEYEDSEEEDYEEPVLDIEATGEADDMLCEDEDENAEYVTVGVDPEEDALAAEGEEIEIEDLEETAESDEEVVGKHFLGYSSYLSKAVGYMRIHKLLNNSGTVNNSVTVAVIDTGYDTSSTCVSYSRVLTNKGVCLYGGSMHDAHGHGTFVLNQIYEATNFSVKLIPINMYDDSGNSAISMAEAAIYKAVNLGASVINYSNGASMSYAETYSAGEAALQYALNHKCYLSAAAGNDDESAYYQWPANSSKCITISAISYNDGYITSYSNYGSAVDFAAPGGDSGELIYGYTRNNRYIGYAGTSMAAPYYTAIIANLKANGRSYSSLSKLISSLTNYCNSSLTSSDSFYVGHGCVDLSKAINRSITQNAFKDFGSRTYTGSAIKPNPTVTYGGTKIKRGRDYSITYSNNVNVGTAKITVKGRGLYHGSASGYFKIVARSVAKASVKTKSYSYSYTGSPRQPAVIVKLNGKTLTKGRDYTVSYSNNTGPGQATATIKGKGNYKGTKSCKFGISKHVESIISGYAYILVPKAATGRAVALKNSGMTNNTRLFINTKTCSEAQQFKITKNSDGTYTLKSVKCGLAMDSYNGKTGSGVAGVIRNYSSSRKSQRWYIKKCKDGSFLFVNKNSGKVLSSESGAKKGAYVNMHSRSNSTAQRFYLERVSTKAVKHTAEGVFSLRSAVNTGFAMDVYAASKQSGAKVQIYKYNGSKAQKFRFIYSGDGTYRIVNINSGKVLMPTGSKAKKGAAIVQGVWKGKTCQRWEVKKRSDGKYILHNCAGYYLELTGNTAKNGVKLRLNSYQSAKRNRWVRRSA